MSATQPEKLQAFFSQGVFRGTCPACNAAEDFEPAEFADQIFYTCECGREYEVQPLGLRGGQRKQVNLPASLSLNSKRVPCVVRDLSIKGMGVMLDLLNLDVSGTLQLRVKLDDRRNTALLLPCTVSRRYRDGNLLLLGLKFERLDLDSESALSCYLSQ